MQVEQANMNFVCQHDNDLYKLLADTGYLFPCYNSIEEAIQKSAPYTGVLVLSSAYPKPEAPVSRECLNRAKAKNLRLYIEYNAIEGLTFGEPVKVSYERAVVTSDFFGATLPKDTILVNNGCWFLPCKTDKPILGLARVAGYDKAVFGLPQTVVPLLFRHPEFENVLLCTSCLSNFVRARYAPKAAWKSIKEQLLMWLTSGRQAVFLEWKPLADTAYTSEETLPPDAESLALEGIYHWFRNHALYGIDVKKGVVEGFESCIDHEGRQTLRTLARGDCIGESAMVFAFQWAAEKDPDKKLLSKQMMDYVLSSDFAQNDPESPIYGLNNWSERNPVFYGDDNARVILSGLVCRRLLQTTRWDEKILKCLLANLRTTNQLGFRRNRLDVTCFTKNNLNWTDYEKDTQLVSYAPHYQAYLWAAYLWAYGLTGFDKFLTKTQNAISMTMKAYPDQWIWTNSLTAEIARMILPLAFLVRVSDTPQHREWLIKMVDDLLLHMDASGAIQDYMGNVENGKYPPPKSNEDYGTMEASIIQENGDTATDLLYTAIWAFIGLHEAAIALGDEKIKAAEDRLAAFFCRIQVKSEKLPWLNGCWMRSFDYRQWEYYGSSADAGWGPWCVESGWVNTWMAACFALRQTGESLFSISFSDNLRQISPQLLKLMSVNKTKNWSAIPQAGPEPEAGY